MKAKLYNDDCLKVMDELITEGVKVDMILTDPPYGTTACSWDAIIPFDAMWERINKLVKPNGAIVLFGSEPFSTNLRMSNIKNYKYDWYWIKESGTGFARSHKQPMRRIENAMVFYKELPYYDYKGKKYDTPIRYALPTSKSNSDSVAGNNLDKNGDKIYVTSEYRTKDNIIEVARDNNKVHPTQKPVKLLQYLINTYTHTHEVVLDFTMGSGSTGVACANTDRDFIGIELDKDYFKIAKKRIDDANYNLFNLGD